MNGTLDAHMVHMLSMKHARIYLYIPPVCFFTTFEVEYFTGYMHQDLCTVPTVEWSIIQYLYTLLLHSRRRTFTRREFYMYIYRILLPLVFAIGMQL